MENINNLVQKALEGIELLKHPGHPDQSIHGRRGGGKGGSKKPSGKDDGALISAADLPSGWSSGKSGDATVYSRKVGNKEGKVWKLPTGKWQAEQRRYIKGIPKQTTSNHETGKEAVQILDTWINNPH